MNEKTLSRKNIIEISNSHYSIDSVVVVVKNKMRLIILDSAANVGEWAAKYVLKRIKDFNPGPDRYTFLQMVIFFFAHAIWFH